MSKNQTQNKNENEIYQTPNKNDTKVINNEDKIQGIRGIDLNKIIIEKAKNLDDLLHLHAFPADSCSWCFELLAPITEILEESDRIYISNAFSHEKPALSIREFLCKLNDNMDLNKSIVLEIYGYDGETNEQIVITEIINHNFEFTLGSNINYLSFRVSRVGNVNKK